MKSERIEIGDLVMIVRGHECAVARAGGIPFVVTGFALPYGGGWHCADCDKNDAWGNELAATGLWNGNAPLSWLKKIPPLVEFERELTVDTAVI